VRYGLCTVVRGAYVGSADVSAVWALDASAGNATQELPRDNPARRRLLIADRAEPEADLGNGSTRHDHTIDHVGAELCGGQKGEIYADPSAIGQGEQIPLRLR
jgi:hypothetical protein